MTPVGAVFTPLDWGRFAVERFGIAEAWLAGSSVLDPTMGEGHLLEALLQAGIARGHRPDALPWDRLSGVEIEEGFVRRARERFAAEYGLEMEGRFIHGDIFSSTLPRADIVLANPPWISFADLPAVAKGRYKELFVEYGLTDDRRKLLLGSSRIDLAALVIQRTMRDLLAHEGRALFFAPLSILLNDGAHSSFRRYQSGAVHFALDEVYDFSREKVFPDVGTRYGLLHFTRDRQTRYPLPYHRLEGGAWREFAAEPLLDRNAPLTAAAPEQAEALKELKPIEIRKASLPRQGVNTGGANALFFFRSCAEEDAEHYRLDNEHILPKDSIYPLLTARNFRHPESEPERWVLLPYRQDGKVMSWAEIEEYPRLAEYLLRNRETLSMRKGSMLRASIDRGFWWVMLGVGPYSFAPYKIVWEAYGRSSFRPRLFDGRWQANQSLQAFMPFGVRDEAERVLGELENPLIEEYLRSFGMAGTMNWAQPGKMKRLLRVTCS